MSFNEAVLLMSFPDTSVRSRELLAVGKQKNATVKLAASKKKSGMLWGLFLFSLPSALCQVNPCRLRGDAPDAKGSKGARKLVLVSLSSNLSLCITKCLVRQCEQYLCTSQKQLRTQFKNHQTGSANPQEAMIFKHVKAR